MYNKNMDGEIITSGNNIEIRGEINPEQRSMCEQLSKIIQELGGIEVQAIGMGDNPVTSGGEKGPRVWFRVNDRPTEYFIAVAVNTFKNRQFGVVSNYSFHPYMDRINAVPFGATLNKYVLPEIEIYSGNE